MGNISVETYQQLSTIAFIAAGVLFLLAVAMFFLFNIPKIIGEISGSTARKAIESIRHQNEETGNKAYRPSPVNAARGKITERITPSGRLEQRPGNSGVSVGTAKLQTSELMPESSETTMLSDDSSNETVVLSATGDAGATTVLSANDDIGATTVLSAGAQEGTGAAVSVGEGGVDVEYEIGFTGSAEIIE